jgi:hypothetical protein
VLTLGKLEYQDHGHYHLTLDFNLILKNHFTDNILQIRSIMKISNKIKTIALLSVANFAMIGCKTAVLDDPFGFAPSKTLTAEGAYLSTVGAMKASFDAHQKMGWVAGVVGSEELTTSISTGGSFLFANRIENEKKLTLDNSQNRTIAGQVYLALELAANGRKATEAAFATNAQTKALYLANLSMVEGMMYGDWSKFFVSMPEYDTDKSLSNTEARDKAVSKLQEAITQFQSYNGTTGVDGVTTKGLLVDATVGIKMCNSYIGMLLFDTGSKSAAGAYLAKGYTKADAGKEFGYKNQNTLTGDGIYPDVRNNVEFYVNTYSKSFVDNRIVGDTLRRTPSNWFKPALATPDLRIVMTYFYPQGPVNPLPAGSATVAYNPFITWQEILLMQADPAINASSRDNAVTEVLTSWKMNPKAVTNAVADQTVTIERVARYEYAGRGRRIMAVGTYPKWDLANEFSFK